MSFLGQFYFEGELNFCIVVWIVEKKQQQHHID